MTMLNQKTNFNLESNKIDSLPGSHIKKKGSNKLYFDNFVYKEENLSKALDTQKRR